MLVTFAMLKYHIVLHQEESGGHLGVLSGFFIVIPPCQIRPGASSRGFDLVPKTEPSRMIDLWYNRESSNRKGFQMKKMRFIEEQIIGILNEVESGPKVGEVCRSHGISEGTINTL
jgi:putative transposase